MDNAIKDQETDPMMLLSEQERSPPPQQSSLFPPEGYSSWHDFARRQFLTGMGGTGKSYLLETISLSSFTNPDPATQKQMDVERELCKMGEGPTVAGILMPDEDGDYPVYEEDEIPIRSVTENYPRIIPLWGERSGDEDMPELEDGDDDGLYDSEEE